MTHARHLRKHSSFDQQQLLCDWRSLCPLHKISSVQHQSFSCSGVALVDAHGGQHSAPMLALFERYLEGPAAVGTDEDTYDRVREGLVVLLGTLARHLPPQDPKVRLHSELAHSFESWMSLLKPLQCTVVGQQHWLVA
jgi:hypothetical protein